MRLLITSLMFCFLLNQSIEAGVRVVRKTTKTIGKECKTKTHTVNRTVRK